MRLSLEKSLWRIVKGPEENLPAFLLSGVIRLQQKNH